MGLHISHILHKTNFLTILFTIFLFEQTLSQYHFSNFFCTETFGNYTKGGKFKENLNVVLPKLTSQASKAAFNNFTVGQGIDKVYGLYLCRGDLDNQQCHDCVNGATLSITENCPAEKEAIVWYDECIVRYANRSIFNLEEESPLSYSWSTANSSDPKQFSQLLGETMNHTIKEAAYNKTSHGYATGEVDITLFQTAYMMAQCTPDILGNRCERCLRVALSNMGGCCGTARMSMKMYLPSCWLRYDDSPFLNFLEGPPLATIPLASPPTPPYSSSLLPPPSRGNSGGKTLPPTWITFALLLLIVIGISNNGFAS